MNYQILEGDQHVLAVENIKNWRNQNCSRMGYDNVLESVQKQGISMEFNDIFLG